MLALLIVLNICSVVTRYFFSKPIMWSEEVSLILLVWCVFISLVPVTYKHGAVSLDFFVDMMSSGLRRIVRILVDTFSVVLFVVTCVFSIDLIQRSAFRVTPILQIPFTVVYVPILIGFGVSVIILCSYIFREIELIAGGGKE